MEEHLFYCLDQVDGPPEIDLLQKSIKVRKMYLNFKQGLARKITRLFDAFDLSRRNDKSPSTIAARNRVIDSSNAFLRPFLNLWLVLSVLVGIVSWLRMPQAWYVTAIMMFSGSVARYAVHRGQLPAARWLFLLPLVFLLLIAPPFINGVRTPILVNISSLIILSGWMMGRRVMTFLSLAFAITLMAMWSVEATAFWEMPAPLRDPEVWLRAFLLDLICCTVTVAALIGNYQAELRHRFSLESRLSSVLKFSDTVIQRSPLPMSVYDASGKCIQINEAYQRLFDISRENVLGKNFSELPFSESTNDYLESVRTRTSRQSELRTFTSTENAIWLDLRFLPFEIDGQVNLLVQCIDLTEQKRLNSELEALAFNDSLTGLPNRRLFFDRLDRAIDRRRRDEDHGAVLLLDLDRFKELNDTYGHEVGDKLLIEVADRLRSNVRSTDTVARLGGDEFVLILEGVGDDVADATDHVTRVISTLQLRLSEPYDLGGARFLGSASIGFALFEGTEEEDAAFLLRKADASMYAAKKRHGN